MGVQASYCPTQKAVMEVTSAWCHQHRSSQAWVLRCTSVAYVPSALPHHAHLGLLRDIERPGALPAPISSIFPTKAAAAATGFQKEPSHSFCHYMAWVTFTEAVCRPDGWGEPSCGLYLHSWSTGGTPAGLHHLREDPTEYTLGSAPRPPRLNSGSAAILIPQRHLQKAGRGGMGLHSTSTHVCMGVKAGSWASLGPY